MSFNKKPIRFNLNTKYNDIEFFVDIDSKGIVQAIGYLSPSGIIEELEKFCKKSLSNRLIDLEIESKGSFFGMTQIIYQNLIHIWEGKSLSWGEQKAKSYEQLICRCFGVYRDEIIDFFERKPLSSLVHLTSELKAGGGCTSCLFDLEKLQVEYRKKLGLVTGEKRKRYKNKNPLEALIIIGELFEEILKFSPEVIELRERFVLVKGKRETHSLEEINQLNTHLKNELGIHIIFEDEDSAYSI